MAIDEVYRDIMGSRECLGYDLFFFSAEFSCHLILVSY
ncbi:hypothetical protein PULV_a0408 [Pseudoalteromonas ulvae UL12]|nr:hypothetical protein [Pseudoalteromonas ulvae UL12]